MKDENKGVGVKNDDYDDGNDDGGRHDVDLLLKRSYGLLHSNDESSDRIDRNDKIEEVRIPLLRLHNAIWSWGKSIPLLDNKNISHDLNDENDGLLNSEQSADALAIPSLSILSEKVDLSLSSPVLTTVKLNKAAHTNGDANILPFSESKATFKRVPSMETYTDTSTGIGGGTSFTNDSSSPIPDTNGSAFSTEEPSPSKEPSTSLSPLLDIKDSFTVGPIDLTGFQGQLIAIVGSVASGKSTLLLGCLGEVYKNGGVVEVSDIGGRFLSLGEDILGGSNEAIRRNREMYGNVNEIQMSEKSSYTSGSVSYCQQVPAMHSNISVRANILMGAVFDPQRYEKVFIGCCLDQDAKGWEDGDLLVITPSSSNLSGGQRLRIGVARALYAPSHTVLLDDPFSALDASTSVEIMKFIELEKKNRLIVITTHSLKLLIGSSARIITLESGRQIPPPSQDSHGVGEEWSPLVVGKCVDDIDKNDNINHENRSDDNGNIPVYYDNSDIDDCENSISDGGNCLKHEENDEKISTENININKDLTKCIEKNNENEIKNDAMKFDDTLPLLEKDELEHMKSGHINKNIFRTYLHATGPCLALIVIFSTIIMQVSSNSMAFWLACWSNSSTDRNDSMFIFKDNRISKFQDFFKNVSSEKFLEVAAIVILVNIVFAILRSFLFALGGLSAARTLYRKLSKSVFNADILFFENVSIGQIINR